jgi:serine/threonine protein kinase
MEANMRPRELLEGEKLSGGWTVGKMIHQKGGTGANFSVGYTVHNDDGRNCYLKAMKLVADLYDFEKKICEACRDFHLRRVVHAIESGSIVPHAAAPYGKVEYIIFEMADGDVRRHLDQHAPFDTAFMLRVVHNVAVALEQLHTAQMAHQDVKPSNIMMFPKDIGAKIGDLGRAWTQMFPGPHDNYIVPGDGSYAPLELIYRDISPDHRCRRFAADLYHFGNIIAFVFARAHMNTLIGNHLPRPYHPGVWGGTYREVLPYIQAAFVTRWLNCNLSYPSGRGKTCYPWFENFVNPTPKREGIHSIRIS